MQYTCRAVNPLQSSQDTQIRVMSHCPKIPPGEEIELSRPEHGPHRVAVIPQAPRLLSALSRPPTRREAVAVTLGFRLLDFRGAEYAPLICCRLKGRALLSTQR